MEGLVQRGPGFLFWGDGKVLKLGGSNNNPINLPNINSL